MKLANSSFERITQAIKDAKSSTQWVHFMNHHGFRDDIMRPNGALPDLTGNGLNTTKTLYLKDRLSRLNDSDELRLALIEIINSSPEVNESLSPILLEDNLSIHKVDDHYEIEGVAIVEKPAIEIAPSFADTEQKILTALENAKVSIRAALAWFTNQTLADKLVEKYHEGVEVAVAVFIHPANLNYKVNLQDVPLKWVRGTRGGIMHHKFCVIDNQTVILGSYNWTAAAETKNDENANVISGDNDLATQYSLEFRRLTGGFR